MSGPAKLRDFVYFDAIVGSGSEIAARHQHDEIAGL